MGLLFTKVSYRHWELSTFCTSADKVKIVLTTEGDGSFSGTDAITSKTRSRSPSTPSVPKRATGPTLRMPLRKNSQHLAADSGRACRVTTRIRANAPS